MSLFDGLKNIFKTIPIVGDVIGAISGPPAGAGGDMGYINSTDPVDPVTGFIKRTGKSFAEGLAKQTKKRATVGENEIAPPTLGANVGNYKLRQEQIPGYNNPRFKSLYDMYDLDKIMKKNLILSRAEVMRVPRAEAPSGPNIKPNRGVKYLED